MLATTIASILGLVGQGITAYNGAKAIKQGQQAENKAYNENKALIEGQINTPYMEDSQIRSARTALRDSSIDAYNRLMASRDVLGLTDETIDAQLNANANAMGNYSSNVGVQADAVKRQETNQLQTLNAQHANSQLQAQATKANMLAQAGNAVGNVMGNVIKGDTNTLQQDVEGIRSAMDMFGLGKKRRNGEA